ncbi:FMN-dependent NADH-azoreductase [Paenibacillus montanisoli]|uniref:FMN dependent NADH:quinone oxidoreductase n=1 Tax=Paenibacillus montanisoli TaxID=2081970 RepID=A0A328U027_9BACL|nr:FMN-dependent NADH-azoreductase [Paenibacillus montanisoli]RAP76148.1 FMN-dependent NADH-azoreductase [Paenibacillus montanisoli]
MAKVLYITAHPHDHQTSYSLAVGKAFIDSYRESHPQDEIVHLDLYNIPIPHIDADVFSGWGKLRSGGDFSQLSAEEQQKVTRLGELVDQFVEADKYVFATPMWNFSYPPIMKAYIDAICVAGKTFKYTAQGPVGLLPNKSAIHIQARGGVYSEGPAAEMECGHRHLTAIMSFFGITDFKGIFVEGMNAMPDQAESIKAKAIEEAQKEAKVFGNAMVETRA